VFVILAIIFEYFQFDIPIAKFWFELEGGLTQWSLRHSWVLDNVLHVGGRHLVILISAIVLGSMVLSFWKSSLQPFKKSLVLLFLSVLSTVLLVRLGKDLSHVSCPWDLSMFGGSHDYLPTFAKLPIGSEFGVCFPGGHSSGGYAWVALYYFGYQHCPKQRWKGLMFGLVLGGIFSLSQQLRGAHFFSHGIWSLGIAWLVSTSFYYLFYVRNWQLSTAETIPRQGKLAQVK
jgi:membrane-associated PAP2 superfamily phosphatase